ncbi:unnamed protein product (macronuclear) [Paramecium tetraurelia]|uniref:Uncharacterized protein n=1 Tax=Paramecium tetraurelia TaxID=5888 RepID=A0DYM9_PARTE|nr:uncharacterized protein GSPATT00003114001 [Paramecium tetraurelia]CAK88146.1 unnamed protein product [Paramecium tetraurelia]|eukprot:XP_001455543.1 hypothetical protein (macronuclear) [Paramecium tetraurelia strain d4-2]
MSRSFSCSDPKFNLFNGGLGCSIDGCGQYNKCLSILNDKFIETTGCCRMKILEPNFVTVFVYMLIVPVIGIASLGALGGGIVKRPFLQSILNFDASIAGDITACLMISAQIVNMVFIFLQNHPDVPERPVINYDIAIIYTLAIPVSLCLGSDLANFLPLLPLLSFQILFFLAISPVLIYYARRQNELEDIKDQNSDVVKESALLTMSQQQIQNNNDYTENQAKLYKQLYAEQCQRFPLVPILITLGNFAINELLLLLRSSPYQYSPYFFPEGDINNQNKDKGPCEPWNFYMVLLLTGVNFMITGSVYFFMRKKELLKNTVNFYPHERFFTPPRRFFYVYAAGFLTGFVAGFVGMAAGLTMVVTMVRFKLIAAVAGATANYCYFLICIQVFTSFLVGASQSQGLPVGEQFFFYALGVLAVLTFTNYGYRLLKKYNIGHIIFYIDFAIVILNIMGNIAWGIENGYRDGFHSLEQQPSTCGNFVLDN